MVQQSDKNQCLTMIVFKYVTLWGFEVCCLQMVAV